LDSYKRKLLAAGHTVVVVEQVGTQPINGLLLREVVEVARA
jgi:hypothetical protein